MTWPRRTFLVSADHGCELHTLQSANPLIPPWHVLCIVPSQPRRQPWSAGRRSVRVCVPPPSPAGRSLTRLPLFQQAADCSCQSRPASGDEHLFSCACLTFLAVQPTPLYRIGTGNGLQENTLSCSMSVIDIAKLMHPPKGNCKEPLRRLSTPAACPARIWQTSAERGELGCCSVLVRALPLLWPEILPAIAARRGRWRGSRCVLSGCSGGSIGAVPITPIASDQDYGVNALDNANPNRYFGPSVLDRAHQLSFGGCADLPWGFQAGTIGHFWSPLSTSLVVPNTNLETSDRVKSFA